MSTIQRRLMLYRAALTLALLCVPAAGTMARSGDGRLAPFVGVKKCGGCHEKARAAWEKGPHARAGRSLGRRSDARRCQGCHTTGEAPAGRPRFAGVQCEACHGAGIGYAERDIMRNPVLSRELGLTDLSTPEARAELCARCHRAGAGLRLAPFDAESAWKEIVHQ